MCVKIIAAAGTITKYDSKKPLEDQVKSDCQVVVNYESKDPDIEAFLDEMERLCKNGISTNIKVDVKHGNTVKGAKAKKQVRRLMKDLNLNEAIKILTTLNHSTNKTLEELANFCLKR